MRNRESIFFFLLAIIWDYVLLIVLILSKQILLALIFTTALGTIDVVMAPFPPHFADA